MKVEIKGFVHHLDEIKETKNHNYVQDVIIKKPARTNEFGETIGKDQFYKCTVFRKDKQDLPDPFEYAGKKVSCEAYLNGEEFTTTNGLAYALKLNVKELKLLES